MWELFMRNVLPRKNTESFCLFLLSYQVLEVDELSMRTTVSITLQQFRYTVVLNFS